MNEDRLDFRQADGKTSSNKQKQAYRFNVFPEEWSHRLLPVSSGVFQVVSGLVLVSLSLLGLIFPIWLSAFFSLLGSATVMSGAFMLYQALSNHYTFDKLINQSIRRAINDQN